MKLAAGVLAAAVLALVALIAARGARGQELSLRPSTSIGSPAAIPAPGRAGSVAPTPGGKLRGALFLRADRLEGDNQRITAEGHVELRTRNETVLADKLSYSADTQVIHGVGDVLLRRGDDWISGPELEYKRDTETGFFKKPRYFVSAVSGHGAASEIRFIGPGRYEASDATYTTCVASDPDWYLRGDELKVDNLRKVGTVHDATVHFLNIPVLYTPWLDFPLSDARKSGFLTPALGSTGVRGLEVTVPYYLNLAPNYDATLTPRLMSKRGLMLGTQFRYLLENPGGTTGQATGEIDAEYLPHDHVTGDNRYELAWKHTEQFEPWLSGFVNLNKVSDDTYFADFANNVAVTSQKSLPRDVGLQATDGPWTVLARAQSFQTLQDPNAPIVPPYNRLPQVLASLRDTDWLGLTWGGMAEFARFSQPALVPTGDRLVMSPTVAWSRQGSAWFFTARTGIQLREYALDQTTATLPDLHPGYAIPITSVDAGLFFERDLDIANTPLTQTLEPRAYYVYVPYRNQDNAPVFDTALDDFNFSQLFSDNRFIGSDRIGDANQMTLALTSRFLDQGTGGERLRLAVGQRFYFEDQRVSLPGSLPSSATSDILVSAEGKLSDAWSLASLLQYNLDNSAVNGFNAGFRYTPSLGRALNFTWRYTRSLIGATGLPTQIKQVDVSGQWPLSARWNVIGRWNYSLYDRKTLEGVAGIEYNRDCWVLRVVGQRLITTTEQTTTSVFVQLELNGLARVGTSPLDLLRRSIPGYRPTNAPVPPASGPSPLPEY